MTHPLSIISSKHNRSRSRFSKTALFSTWFQRNVCTASEKADWVVPIRWKMGSGVFVYCQAAVVKDGTPYTMQTRTGNHHQEVQEINKPKSVTRAIESKGRIAP